MWLLSITQSYTPEKYWYNYDIKEKVLQKNKSNLNFHDNIRIKKHIFENENKHPLVEIKIDYIIEKIVVWHKHNIPPMSKIKSFTSFCRSQNHQLFLQDINRIFISYNLVLLVIFFEIFFSVDYYFLNMSLIFLFTNKCHLSKIEYNYDIFPILFVFSDTLWNLAINCTPPVYLVWWLIRLLSQIFYFSICVIWWLRTFNEKSQNTK